VYGSKIPDGGVGSNDITFLPNLEIIDIVWCKGLRDGHANSTEISQAYFLLSRIKTKGITYLSIIYHREVTNDMACG
jgi:hypothetical protein